MKAEREEVMNPVVLTCWKDIARYLGKGVRTVQRWEREFGLPVRRPTGIDHKSAVVAYTRDLDSWLASRWSERNDRSKRTDAALTQTIESFTQNIGKCVELISTSRELRNAHAALLHETTAALTALVSSFSQFEPVKGIHPKRAQLPTEGMRE
jgi:hypothetical protein